MPITIQLNSTKLDLNNQIAFMNWLQVLVLVKTNSHYKQTLNKVVEQTI